MKKEKYRKVSVYYEKGKAAVTVSKAIVKKGSRRSCNKQHIVRWLPFLYKTNHSGSLSIDSKADVVELHKGDTIKVTKYGKIVLTNKKKEKKVFSI